MSKDDGRFRAIVRDAAKRARPTVLDKAIAWLSPEKGATRQRARIQMAALDAYNGASRSRRDVKKWLTSTGSAITDLHGDLPELRNRSRDAMRNMPVARGVIRRNVINVVGTGLRMRPSIDRDVLGLTDEQADEWQRAAKAEFELWSKHADLCGHDGFRAMQSLVMCSRLVNGDLAAVFRFKEFKGHPYALKIQLIEADRIANPNGAMDSEKIAGGVEVDRDGRPIRLHILKVHPGDWWIKRGKGPTETVPLPIYDRDGERQVLHIMDRERIGQLRGAPELAPVLGALKQLERFSDAELMAAVISAMFTVFITSEEDGGLDDLLPGTADTGTDAQDEIRLGNGMIMNLAPGEKIDIANPSRPNAQFDPFFRAIVQQIGLALDLPFEVVMMQFQSSYSASRAALEVAHQMFMTRRSWLVDQFCQPVYERFLAEAVARGRLTAPGFFTDPAMRAAWCRAMWIGPARMSIDPVKDANADEKWIAMGVKTGDSVTAERTGGEFTSNIRQLGKEARLKSESGLAAAATAPGGPAEAPAPAETEEDRPEAGDSDDDSQGDNDDETR